MRMWLLRMWSDRAFPFLRQAGILARRELAPRLAAAWRWAWARERRDRSLASLSAAAVAIALLVVQPGEPSARNSPVLALAPGSDLSLPLRTPERAAVRELADDAPAGSVEDLDLARRLEIQRRRHADWIERTQARYRSESRSWDLAQNSEAEGVPARASARFSTLPPVATWGAHAAVRGGTPLASPALPDALERWALALELAPAARGSARSGPAAATAVGEPLASESLSIAGDPALRDVRSADDPADDPRTFALRQRIESVRELVADRALRTETPLDAPAGARDTPARSDDDWLDADSLVLAPEQVKEPGEIRMELPVEELASADPFDAVSSLYDLSSAPSEIAAARSRVPMRRTLAPFGGETLSVPMRVSTSVPEPGTGLMLAVGLLALAGRARPRG